MFKKLKQKIESESEGEQSPVSRNERTKKRSNEVRSIEYDENTKRFIFENNFERFLVTHSCC